jgi:hypothetical protein
MDRIRSDSYLDQQLSASYCAYELEDTHGIRVVDKDSARRLATTIRPINANHINIVQPSDKQSSSYLAFKSAFAETIGLRPTDASEVPRWHWVDVTDGQALNHYCPQIANEIRGMNLPSQLVLALQPLRKNRLANDYNDVDYVVFASDPMLSSRAPTVLSVRPEVKALIGSYVLSADQNATAKPVSMRRIEASLEFDPKSITSRYLRFIVLVYPYTEEAYHIVQQRNFDLIVNVNRVDNE